MDNESRANNSEGKWGIFDGDGADFAALFDDDIAPQALIPGDRIGRYELIEILGEGGFGSVWKAKQLDIERLVALKLIRHSQATPETLSRFERERQALALMEHDHIAKVYEAGVHEGSLFLTMEHIPGVPLTYFVRQKKLNLRERIALFIPICRAIHHAHQKLVLHRDLKPGNILVMEQDGAAIAKVIDFGIAKPLTSAHPMLRADTGVGPATLPGYRLGTPQYMSPEQARGSDAISAASDTYSLGIVLYELLVGEPPVTKSALALLDDDLGRLHHIASFEPTLPSTLWLQLAKTNTNTRHFDISLGDDPRRLSREMRGDIDWIIHKALEKLPAQRYASADKFADDLQAYLENKPVSVGPPTFTYQWKKFYLRNKIATLGAAAVLTAIVLGGGLAYWQWRVAVQARNEEIQAHHRTERALAAEERARKLAVQREQEAEEARAKETKARIASDRARAEAEELIAFMLYDMRESLEPVNRTDLLTKVALRAEQYLTSQASVAGENPDQSKNRAAMYQNKGLIEMTQGKVSAAIASFQSAFDIIKQLTLENPKSADGKSDLAILHSRLGMAYQANEKISLAKLAYQQEQEIVLTLLKESPNSTRLQHQLATTYEHLGDLSDDPLPLYTQDLELSQKLAQQVPESPEIQRTLATAHERMAATLLKRNRVQEALPHCEEELKLISNLKAKFPGDVRIQRAELIAYQHQAHALLAANQAVLAEPILEKLHSESQAIAKDDTKNELHQQDLANVEILWADCQMQMAAKEFLSGEVSKIKNAEQRLLKVQAFLKNRPQDKAGRDLQTKITGVLKEFQSQPQPKPQTKQNPKP